jgi:PAS domain S-box-containing protein
MRDSKKSGKKSIKKSKRQRVRKSKLKYMSREDSKDGKAHMPKAAEDLYQAMMNNNNFGFTLIDRNYKIIMVNHVMVEFLNKPVSELIGRECFREYEQRDSICPHCPGRKTMTTGQQAEVETEGVRDDGVRISVRNQTFPTFDSDGTITGFIEIVEDITERKKAEQELRDSEELYHAIFDQAADSVVLIDAETGEMVEFNDKAHENLEYTREEFEKLRLADLEVIESEKEVAEHIETIIKKGSGVFETKHRTKKGEERDIYVSARAISLRGKNFIQGIWRDITEPKKAEQKLREDRQQLRSLASELTLAEERERSRIAAELHDETIQTVSIAKMRLEELRESVQDKELDKKIEQIGNSLGKAIKDIRSLMFKVSSPIFEQFGFEEAVQDWLIEEIEKKHGIKTEFKNDGQKKPLDDDVSALLFRNVRELLINVVKHSRATRVKVSISKVDSKIKTCVEDNGIGFDPGKVVDKAVSKRGFGLFSIRQRLEQFEGSLEIESEPGRGCCIIMTVPLKQE